MRNIIVVSDLHCGCQYGLLTRPVKVDGGGEFSPSPLQLEVAKCWREFWMDWVPSVTKGEPYIIVDNGDTIDGSHHNSTTQITHNLTDQRKIAESILDPILTQKNCKGFYLIRGTEVHVGHSGDAEEQIAKDLGAIPTEDGLFSRWELRLRFGYKDRLIHFTHHVGTTNSAAYESTAVYKELVEAYNEAGRYGNEPPAMVVRSHRHRNMKVEVPNRHGMGTAICTPGWQLKTPFVFRGALGRSGNPHVGGILIRDGKEDGLYTRSMIWQVKQSQEERLPKGM